MSQSTTEQVVFRIPPETLARVRELSRKTGITRAEQLRQAFDLYLAATDLPGGQRLAVLDAENSIVKFLTLGG